MVPPRAGRLAAAAPLLLAWLLVGTAAHAQADRDYRYDNPGPAFSPGGGPVVCFDAGHNNFHTAAGDYWPYAQLLRGDGFTTRGRHPS